MESLIPVVEFQGQKGAQAVSARALYAYLYPTDEMAHFSRWAESSITTDEFAERGHDWVVFSNSGENPQGGRPSMDYHLRLDFAKHLAMQARTESGKRVRSYFIAVEAQARLTTLQDQWGLPKTYSAALLALADRVEAHEKAEAQIVAQAPLVAYAEKVQGAPNTYTVDTTAKELGIPPLQFRKFVQARFLFRRGKEWLPREEYTQRGWFEVRTSTFESGLDTFAYHVTKVTGLGRVKLKDAWDKANAREVQAFQ